MFEPVLANIGVPMIFLTLPPMVVLLVPVIFLEILASRKLIKNEERKNVWRDIVNANVYSTLIGWPVAWVIMVLVQLFSGGGGMYGLDSPMGVFLSVTLQAPWLIPYSTELYWMIPVAMGVLLVPFFFVSVFVEWAYLRKIWIKEEKKDIIRFSWKSHVYSYAFLILVVIAYGAYSINRAEAG